jgi:hypothetical protein
MRQSDFLIPISTAILLLGCRNSTVMPVQTKDSVNKPIASDSNVKKIRSTNDIKRLDTDVWKMTSALKKYLVDSIDIKNIETIDSDAVVFVYPDSIQVEQMKREYGVGFYDRADDEEFYMSEARKLFDSLKIKHITPQKRYIKFSSKTKMIYFDTRAKGSDAWITILFRTDSLPRIISAIDLQTSSVLRGYFNRK